MDDSIPGYALSTSMWDSTEGLVLEVLLSTNSIIGVHVVDDNDSKPLAVIAAVASTSALSPWLLTRLGMADFARLGGAPAMPEAVMPSRGRSKGNILMAEG